MVQSVLSQCSVRKKAPVRKNQKILPSCDSLSSRLFQRPLVKRAVVIFSHLTENQLIRRVSLLLLSGWSRQSICSNTAIPICLFVWIVGWYLFNIISPIKQTPNKHLEYGRGFFRSAEISLFITLQSFYFITLQSPFSLHDSWFQCFTV